jgi:hypothetical protein
MPRMTAKDVKARIDSAWRVNDNWSSMLNEVYSLSCPGRNKFQEKLQEGEEIGNEVFDSTLEHSLNRLANRIVAELFPPFQDWAKYIPGTTIESMGDDAHAEVRAQTEAATAVVMASLKNTNFPQAVHEVILDFAHGTGFMLVVDTPAESGGLLEFVAVNPAEVAVDHGPRGAIWGIFRKHKMKPHLVEQTWPDAKISLTDWKHKLDNSHSSPYEVELEEAFYHCPKSNKWYMDILMKESDKGTPNRILEREYDKTRWLVPRWTRFTGEARGRGPVLQAFHTARTLNKAKELLLVNGSIQIQPPINYIDDGVFNPAHFDLSPLSLNAVGYNKGGPRGATVERMDLGGDLQLTQFVFEEMQMDIKKIMLDDQLPPEAGAVRSATEWTTRQKELNDSKAAPFARFFSEFTRPLMDILLDVHQRAKVLQSEFSVDGHVVDVQITSPFAQAQNINEVNTMSQFVELVTPLGPEIMAARVKLENAPKYYARRMGLKENEFVRSEEEAQQIVEAAQQQQQGEAEAEHARGMEQQNAGQQQQQGGLAGPQEVM